MNRLVVFYFVLLLGFVSCNRDENKLANSTDFVIAVGSVPDSKVAFELNGSDGIDLSWEVGDKLTIYQIFDQGTTKVGDYSCLSVDKNSGEAQFSGSILEDGGQYVAVYPQSDFQSLSERDEAPIGKTTQIGNGTYDHLDAICKMKCSFTYSSSSSIAFSHELALLSLINNGSTTPKALEVVVGEYNSIEAYRVDIEEDSSKDVVKKVNLMIAPREKDEVITVRFFDQSDNGYGFIKRETNQDFVAGGHYLASSEDYSSLQNYQYHQGEELEFTIEKCGAPDDLIPADAVTKNFVTEYGAPQDGSSGVRTLLQSSITSLSESGGGIIYFPKGTYLIGGVNMKSNVHLQFEAGSVVRPEHYGNAKKIYIFSMSDGANFTENVSITGVNGRFMIEIDTSSTGQAAYAFGAGSVHNFLVSDIDIYDMNTAFPMFIFTPDSNQDPDIFGPSYGTIKNMSAFNCHYGYGLVQAHCGKGLYFENLYGLGGVTLRLETGAKGMNENQFGGVFDIKARNIYCDNGNAALMIAPHSMHNGVVQIDGVTSKSSGFAVRTEGGYTSSKYDETLELGAGSFAEGCFVKNVVATWGHDAQIKWKHFKYLPSAFEDDHGTYINDYYIGAPAIAAVLDSDNLPSVKVGKVESYGFLNSPVIH